MLRTSDKRFRRIGVGHRKGGTGKTTTAVLLALALGREFPEDTIYLVDADATNDSATAWHLLAGESWPVNVVVIRWEHETGERLLKFIERSVPALAHLVIDSGPHAQDALADAMRATERFIVPLRPSMMETVSLTPTLQIAAHVDDEKPLNLIALFSQVVGRSRVRRSARAYIEEMGVPVFMTEIPSSVTYIQAFGCVPRELGRFPELLTELIAIEGEK